MINRLASVLNVAAYVLKKTGDITAMKLEKLVYYCQAWSLAWDEQPLFSENIEAWANGPVCPELFNSHRGKFVVNAEMYSDYDNFSFSRSQRETMDKVLDYYGDKTPVWLSDLTHKESPWIIARDGIPNGAACSNVITLDSMQQYYGGL